MLKNSLPMVSSFAFSSSGEMSIFAGPIYLSREALKENA
jgi:hypothetical protein